MARTIQTARTSNGSWRPPKPAVAQSAREPPQNDSSDKEPEVSEPEPGATSPHDLAIWNERAGVRGEIEDWLRHNSSPEHPPCSPGELITMAILCSHKNFLMRDEIVSWVLQNIAYYRDQAVDFALTNIRESARHRHGMTYYGDIDEGLDTIEQGFDCAEAPLYFPRTATDDVEPGYSGAVCMGSLHGEDAATITTPTLAGQIYLRGLLEPEREGFFRFLDLPPELRNAIYEMVLGLPDAGIKVYGSRPYGSRIPDTSLRLCGREDDAEPGNSASRPLYGLDLFISMEKALALLFANKQINAEATPVFWAVNTFVLAGMSDLHRFVARVGADRLRHVRGLSLQIDLRDMVMSMPAQIPITDPTGHEGAPVLLWGLRPGYLHLELSGGDSALNKRLLGRCGGYDEPQSVPGAGELVMLACRAGRLVVQGTAEVMGKYIVETAEYFKAHPEEVEKIEQGFVKKGENSAEVSCEGITQARASKSKDVLSMTEASKTQILRRSARLQK